MCSTKKKIEFFGRNRRFQSFRTIHYSFLGFLISQKDQKKKQKVCVQHIIEFKNVSNEFSGIEVGREIYEGTSFYLFKSTKIHENI